MCWQLMHWLNSLACHSWSCTFLLAIKLCLLSAVVLSCNAIPFGVLHSEYCAALCYSVVLSVALHCIAVWCVVLTNSGLWQRRNKLLQPAFVSGKERRESWLCVAITGRSYSAIATLQLAPQQGKNSTDRLPDSFPAILKLAHAQPKFQITKDFLSSALCVIWTKCRCRNYVCGVRKPRKRSWA